jgi:uncharacterized membrane protein YvbJ
VVVCQACGTENPPGATFCSQCARKLDPETQQAVVKQRASHSATGINWSSVIIAVIVVLIIAAVLALAVTHVI